MKTILLFLIIILLNGCLVNDPLNQPFQSINPRDINDGITISTPSQENLDSLALTDIYRTVYAQNNLWSLRSLLVFRNGKLIAEDYLKDEKDIHTRHLIWSSTKQVMGILAGIAIEQGFINSIDDSISQYFTTELTNHKDKSSITIRDLLTMKSDIDYENDGTDGETFRLLQQIPDNSVKFILSRPLRSQPGTEFHYNDGDPHLLSAIIQKVTGKPTDVWADEVLFSKIGMENYNWVRYKDGITLGGFGIETTPREMAKIALCVADSGNWNHQQIIPFDWVQEMVSPQAETDQDYSFGYYWWIDTFRDICFMWGHGGQFAFIVPSQKIVIVMTSFPNTQGDYQIQPEEALPIVDLIIAAVY